MNRKQMRVLLISFFMLVLLVILDLFIDFGKITYIIYLLLIVEFLIFFLVYIKKLTFRLLFRRVIGILIISFFLLLIAIIISYFYLKNIPNFIGYLLTIDILILFSLYIRKRARKEKTVINRIGYLVSIIIPLLILGYIIYMNCLPFGFEKTYVLDVGIKEDTLVTNEIYLEKSDAMFEPMQEGNKTFRKLEGSTNLIFKPKAVLKNATIDVEIIGDNVFIATPMEFDYSKYNWDLSIDFSKGIPDFLEGNVEFIDECAYFDGQSSLYYPNTHDQFEKGPFTIYVEWTPENNKDDFQQIIGHYNWFLMQDKNKLSFRVGRMNHIKGEFYSISYPINSDFFNNKHSALAIYNPSKNGYIEFFVDNKFIGRKNIGKSTILQDYNKDKPLSFGKSEHGGATYYIGYIHKAMFGYGSINLFVKKTSFNTNNEFLKIPLAGYGKIELIKVHVNEE